MRYIFTRKYHNVIISGEKIDTVLILFGLFDTVLILFLFKLFSTFWAKILTFLCLLALENKRKTLIYKVLYSKSGSDGEIRTLDTTGMNRVL